MRLKIILPSNKDIKGQRETNTKKNIYQLQAIHRSNPTTFIKDLNVKHLHP